MQNNKKGKLIIIEGGDFAGKSTFIEQLKEVHPDFKFTREPGNKLNTDTARICEDLRKVLLNNKNSADKEAKLFAITRELHTMDIVDLINQGHNVVVDRYILSSFAYQAYANNLGYGKVYKYNENSIYMLNDEDIELNILIFKVNKETLEYRKSKRQKTQELDEIEKRDEEFFNRVNAFFNDDIYKEYLKDLNVNVYDIDSSRHKDIVFEDAYKYILDILNK